MTKNYHAAAGLASVLLTDQAAPGIYLIDQPADAAGLFWVVKNERDDSVPIELRGAVSANQFHIMPLYDGWEGGSGLYLGSVEVQVDVTPGSWSHEHVRQPGAITIASGKVAITAKTQRGAATFTVGKGVTATGVASIGFRCWRLVQRDHRGEPIVMFEQG